MQHLPPTISSPVEFQRRVSEAIGRLGNVGSIRWSVSNLTSSGNASAGSFCNVDASGGSVTVTLPAASTSTGYQIQVRKKDSSGNAVTVSVSGGGTINGSASQVISTQYVCLTLVSDGTEWCIV